ncbi:potassium channel family protein [Jatrophihabitans sp. DSM 45814]
MTQPLTDELAADLAGHVIVCGLNDVGLRIVEQLHAAGERVLVIDDGTDARLKRIVAALGVELLPGDARRNSVLTEAGITTAAALICVADHDLDNLEVALLARERVPELRLVVQLTNAAVGRAVSRLTGPGSVLDAAALAAPSFVEATQRRRVHELVLGGESFQVTERLVEHPANLRSAFGDLAPIAVVPVDGGDLIACPGRDLVVHPGDRVTLIGSAQDFAQRRTGEAPGTAGLVSPAEDIRPVRALQHGWLLARTMLGDIERAFWLSLLALGGVGVLSIVLLMMNYDGPENNRMGVVDATYFTVETLTTVGFGDFYFAHQHTWLRLWAILLMILGATLVTILYARLTDLLITRRMSATAGRRRATGMRGHVILIGLGSVGLRVLEQLRAEDRDVVVLERDEQNRYLTTAREMGVPVIIGDSTLRQNLHAANLETASSVAVLTSNDLANIETGLAVDDLLGDRRTEVPVVLRVFDRQLASTIERNFGFRHVRSTSALAAPWFVGAALGLTILNTFYVEGQPFLVGMLTVHAGGGLAGRPMSDLNERIRVIAISRMVGRTAAEQALIGAAGGTSAPGKQSASAGSLGAGGPLSPLGSIGSIGPVGPLEHPPRRDTRFAAGDQAYLVGRYDELLQVLRREHGA